MCRACPGTCPPHPWTRLVLFSRRLPTTPAIRAIAAISLGVPASAGPSDTNLIVALRLGCPACRVTYRQPGRSSAFLQFIRGIRAPSFLRKVPRSESRLGPPLDFISQQCQQRLCHGPCGCLPLASYPPCTPAALGLSSLDKRSLCQVHPISGYFRKTKSTPPLPGLKHLSFSGDAPTSLSGGPLTRGTGERAARVPTAAPGRAVPCSSS